MGRRSTNSRGAFERQDHENAWPSLAIPPALIEQIAQRVAEIVVERLPERPEPYLTVDQAAEYLGCGHRTKPRARIYELVEAKRLRVHRDGKRMLFRRADLDAVLTVEEPESC